MDRCSQDTPKSRPPTDAGTVHPHRGAVFAVAAVLLSLGLCFSVCELLLRCCGYGPWRYSILVNVPVANGPEPDLGWVNKPGVHVGPPWAEGLNPWTTTILPDGRRLTGATAAEPRPAVWCVGGSFTKGYAIADDESYPWQLQAKWPWAEVVNLGVDGYGTYQTLLTLERRLVQGPPPVAVLYGLIPGHEVRNVATAGWLRSIALHSRKGHAWVPYCTLGTDGELLRHRPVRYPRWPLSGTYATVNFVEEQTLELLTRWRRLQQRPVTETLLLAMDDLCRRHQTRLCVVMLDGSRDDVAHYQTLCAAHRIAFVDCAIPRTADLTVPNEGHPNGKLCSVWGERIDRTLGQELRSACRAPGP